MSDSDSTLGTEPDALLRRLRIDEIKERRRRFHKETAERWILEQQFGVGDPKNDPKPFSDSSKQPFDSPVFTESPQPFEYPVLTESPQQFESPVLSESPHDVQNGDKPLTDRRSFLNAFEFFSKNESAADNSSPEKEDPPRLRVTRLKSDSEGSDNRAKFEERKAAWEGRRSRLDSDDRRDLRFEWEEKGKTGGTVVVSSSRLHSPPAYSPHSPDDTSTSSTNPSSPPTIDDVETPSSSSAPDTAAGRQSPEELELTPPVCIRKKPSIPDILVLDPIVISTDENRGVNNDTSSKEHSTSSCRRRPSSILKKRDSSITSDENHVPNSSSAAANSSVSFACEVDPGEEEETGTYRRRSRSYSGSSSGGRRSPRRRNSAEGHYSADEFNSRNHHPGILKHSCSSLSVDGGSTGSGSAHSDEFKSILKQPARRSSLGSNIHTAHQQTRFSDDYDLTDSSYPSSYTPPHHHRSILKRKSSTSSSQPDVSTSSLRSTASSYSSRESLHEPDPKPILKKKSSSEEISDSDYNSTSITPPPPRPILKNKTLSSSESIPILRSSDQQHPIKPCLKKPCKSFDESALWCNNGSNLECNSVEKSIMRKSSPHICSVKRCEEDKNKEEDEDSEGLPSNKSVLFKRRDSEPVSPTSPFIIMDESSIITRRGSSGSFSFKRKHQIELGKLDFSGVYEGGQQKTCSSSDTSPSSGISSPPGTSANTSPSKKALGQGNAITQKIAALQISGESGWKKRVSKPNPEFEIVDGEAEIGKRAQISNGILANRLSMLESSQETWRKRVSEKDAKEFTVQGKLERAGKKVIESVNSDPTSPTVDGGSTPKKKSSTSSSFKNVFRGIRGSKTDENIVNRAIPVGGSSERGGACVMIAYTNTGDEDSSFSSKSMFQRSKSMRYGRVSGSPQLPPSPQNSSSQSPSTSSPNSSQHVVTVAVTKNDNETFTRFFQSASALDPNFSIIVEDESFNSVIQQDESRQLLGNKRHVKLARNKDRNVRNPIKALAGRIGLQQQSYADVNPEIRERENIRRRIQMENSTSATHAHLSIEALAGLASKEDFTSVKLRRAQQEISAQYPYPMLIRIKGKRFVQTRLAAPEITSVNSGDNFILITQTKLYHFIGEYSNRMERSKSLDVVAHILQKKEFGCNLHTKVVTLQEDTVAGSTNWDSFFEVLGCSDKDRKIRDDVELLGDEADEDYEGKVISRNKIWRVITGDELDEKLLPIRDYWGTVPKHCLLEPSEVLIFDFGPEMYVWSGSKAPVDKKRLGYRLAQEMFEMEGLGKEFDDVKGSKGKDTSEVRRQSWCWLRKVNQHMEPILFIEKFFDWPEEIGRIRVGKNRNSSGKIGGEFSSSAEASAFVPCDGSQLSKSYHEEAAEVSLVLEGFDVKRGKVHVDTQERRNYTISTTKLQTWAISEFSKSEMPDVQLGHFNASSTYVIRWQYTISFVGKDLKGNQSRHNYNTIGGRDRCAYFFWHGKRSKITEQGASALMTVELDDQEEKRELERSNSSGGVAVASTSRGPQIRVEQNYEPPAFLTLFKGKMFINDNQVGEDIGLDGNRKLYVTLGSDEEESHFLEVACSVDSFRSNGCFLLFDFDHRVVYVWIGSGSCSQVQKIALAGANYTVKNPNWSSSISKVVTVKQSHETEAFWSCIVDKPHGPMKWNLISSHGPVEMFRFTSINGRFEAIPVVSPRRVAGAHEAFPVVQEDLYGASVSQPSMFLVLSPNNSVYLWQGWRRIIKREFVPEDEDISQQAVDSIPLTTIWPKYRRCSVETSLNYARFKSVQKAYLVYAGVEPHSFTQIFPYWDYNSPATKEAHDYHLAEGKKEGEKVQLLAVLAELTAKRTYSVDELLEKPEGVDLSRMEDYVSDEDFETLFSMARSQFAQLQPWRKTELKKAVGLF